MVIIMVIFMMMHVDFPGHGWDHPLVSSNVSIGLNGPPSINVRRSMAMFEYWMVRGFSSMPCPKKMTTTLW